MYIGEYYLPQPIDTWRKNETKTVFLWKPGPDSILVPAHDKNGAQLQVAVMNNLGTIGYKSPDARYCAIVKENDTYWIISTEC